MEHWAELPVLPLAVFFTHQCVQTLTFHTWKQDVNLHICVYSCISLTYFFFLWAPHIFKSILLDLIFSKEKKNMQAILHVNHVRGHHVLSSRGLFFTFLHSVPKGESTMDCIRFLYLAASWIHKKRIASSTCQNVIYNLQMSDFSARRIWLNSQVFSSVGPIWSFT